MRARPAHVRLLVGTIVLLSLTLVRLAGAETLQAPIGGKPISLGDARIACAGGGSWNVEGEGKLLRPPTGDDAIGVPIELKVAPNAAACASTTSTVTVVATGRWPTIDATGATVSVDEGRLDVRGKKLKGVRFEWSTSGATPRTGADACTDPKPDGAIESCGVVVPRDLPASATALAVRWWPAGARVDAITFDAEGRRSASDAFVVPVSRVVLSRLLPNDAAIDVTAGSARITLAHPEAVTSVDCTGATCELAASALLVQNVTTTSDKLSLKAHLAPHVFMRKGDALDATPSLTVGLLHCPMTIASDPTSGVDDARIIVRLDGACAASAPSLRYQIDGAPAIVVRTVKDKDSTYVVLRGGRLGTEPIVIQALRLLPDTSVVASASAATIAGPRPHATIELKDVGTIDFIPTNRTALVQLPPLEHGRLVLLPVDGAYTVETLTSGVTTIRGVGKAAGYVSLRYAVRDPALPPPLAGEDLGTLTDSLSYALREANVPAPIGASALGAEPIVELICDIPGSGPTVVMPGAITHVPYTARDSCRFVFHRERVPVEDGAQKLTLEIDVTRVDGATRPESHVREDFVLRPGSEQRLAWIQGVGGEFDRVTVRLSHSADESHYVTSDLRIGAPASQWSVVMGTGKARIYATTAIPTGLYRVSDKAHSGILTLNFGVLSRLTWLDSEGHEGVLGLETGVMGVGLARDTSSSGESLTQVAVVGGLGISVPIANRSLATETSVNLHAWTEYEVSRAWGGYPGNPLAFIFGPSISIGNIGTNL